MPAEAPGAVIVLTGRSSPAPYSDCRLYSDADIDGDHRPHCRAPPMASPPTPPKPVRYINSNAAASPDAGAPCGGMT